MMDSENIQDICRSALWEHISGWEVVITVLLVVSAWVTVQVSRMYYMAKVAKISHHCNNRLSEENQ
jgi:hypothetical protein